MDILPLLDELQTIARNGLTYARDPFDRERYQRLMGLVATYYGQALDMPPAEAGARLSNELGYITPKVGSDVALFDDRGQILLELRRDNERWCLPCGWLEPNESPEEGAVREVREETGLEIRILSLVDVFPIMPSVAIGPHTAVAVVYLGEVIGGSIQVSHESLDVRYWPVDDVPVWHGHHLKYAFRAQRSLARCRRERTGLSPVNTMKTDYPSTPAVHYLHAQKVDFVPHLYPWEEHGGTDRAAAMLGVDEHIVIKTLVMQTDPRHALLILMHGDCEVSTKELARAVGAKHVEPCETEVAQKHTGYLVGGISPFGTRSRMPVYVEQTVLALSPSSSTAGAVACWSKSIPRN